MKKFSPYYQTLYVVWGNQILFLLSLILFFNWYMIPIAIIAMYVFGCLSELSVHRYYTHKSYQTTRKKEILLLIFAILAGQGATVSWVTVHRTHHAFEDTPKDPHTPLYNPWWKILLGLFPTTYDKTIVIDLMRSRKRNWFIFENKYYWLIWTFIWILSYILSKDMFFFIVAGAALWYLATSAVNILNHGEYVGKKKYPESVATNSSLMNFLTGIGHHNNHHANPKSHTYSMQGEVDIYGWVIKKFFKINESS